MHRPGNFNQFDRSALTAYAETDVQRPFGRRFDTNPGDAGAGIADRGDGGGVRHGLGRTPDRDGSGDAGDKIHSVRYIDTFAVDPRFDADDIAGLRRAGGIGNARKRTGS